MATKIPQDRPLSYQWSYGAHLYPYKWPNKVELEWVGHGFWPILHPSTCIHLDPMVPSNPSVKFLQRLLRQPFEDGVTPYPIKTMVDENDGWSLVSWVIIGKKPSDLSLQKNRWYHFWVKFDTTFSSPEKLFRPFAGVALLKASSAHQRFGCDIVRHRLSYFREWWRGVLHHPLNIYIGCSTISQKVIGPLQEQNSESEWHLSKWESSQFSEWKVELFDKPPPSWMIRHNIIHICPRSPKTMDKKRYFHQRLQYSFGEFNHTKLGTIILILMVLDFQGMCLISFLPHSWFSGKWDPVSYRSFLSFGDMFIYFPLNHDYSYIKSWYPWDGTLNDQPH